MSSTSEFLSLIYATFTPLFLIAGSVVLVSRKITMDVKTFARANIYLFAPCLALSSTLNSTMSAGEMGTIVAATIVCGFFMAAAAWGVSQLAGFDRRMTATFILTAIIMNSLNFGLPFITFAFGPEAESRAVIFVIGQLFIVYGLGTFVISRGTKNIQDSLLNVFKMPLPYMALLGIILNLTNSSLPQPVEQAATVLGQATVPCAMVILGLQLGSATLRGRWKPLILIALTRYGIGAGIAFLVAALFDLSGLTARVFILIYAMPVGVTSGVLATQFDGDAEFAAAGVLFTTLFSIIPLSLLLLFTG
ncbi:MAG: putative permease [Cellvibrionaceae bacterium]|jgi:predicted permease